VRTNVYVDGFNLYYGCLKQTPHRWLDLGALARELLPKHQVNRIRHFTAIVSIIPGDGDGKQPLRQQAYLRAIQTIPNLSVHFGHYLTHVRSMPLAVPPATGSRFVDVVKTEEKGSDVNLAAMLLFDAFKQDFEQAVVVSNDSDLALPIELVRTELRLPVGIAFPCSRPGRTPSVRLTRAATFTRHIREPTLGRCHLPNSLADATGVVHKPAAW
jgi:hypothetical protein